EPEGVQVGVTGDGVGLDILGDGFIDVTLAKLRVPEAGAVPDQLVSQAAADAGEEEVPDRVLEHRAVADLEDVVDVCLVAAGPRFGEAHVADTARRLDEGLAGDFRVGLPADAVVRQEAVEL